MYTARRDEKGYIYVTDTKTGRERPFMVSGVNQTTDVAVTDDDELTVYYESGVPTKYRISTGQRA